MSPALRLLLPCLAVLLPALNDGYAALKDVPTKEKADDMESFVLAETFKYFYLLFAPPATLDPARVVLNAEAHPLRASWRE